jgi:predicted sugar kinase
VPEVTGGYETSLLEQLGEIPNSKRERMFNLAKGLEMLTATATHFYAFTDSLQQYLDAAGELFAAGQGGLYNGEAVTQAVGLAKQSGLRAVGQSSWGPTVFGFAGDLSAAQQIAHRLQVMRPNERWQIRICTPARQGANWRWVPAGSERSS